MLVAAFALSKAQLGIVFSAILLGACCCTAISGAFTDRWGERKMLLVSASLMTAALLATTLFAKYWWLVAMMALYGSGYAASTPAGGRAILAWFDRDRGFAMGVRQTGVSVGALVGALAFPLIASAAGYRAAFAFAGVLVAVTSGAAFALYREAPDPRSEPVSLRSVAAGMAMLVRDPRLIGVTLTCMLLSAAQFIVAAFLTITAVNVVHTSVHVAGYALAVAFVGAIGGRLGWGFASDRYFHGDRLVPLAIICVLTGIGAAMLALSAAGQAVPLFFAALLLGVSASGWNGLMAAALSEVGGAERAASALGLGLTAIFGSSAVAPSIFGLTADRTSLHWAWTLTAVMAFVAALPVLRLRAHLAAPQKERAYPAP